MDDDLKEIVVDSSKLLDSTQIRNYAYMLYPDSCDLQKVIDQLSVISDSRTSFLISPLHDKDKFDNGEPKKPHYHVYCMKSTTTNTTYKQAKRFGELLGLVGCEVIHSKVGYARYLCHLDNPNKAQYNIDDVRGFACDYRAIIGNIKDKFLYFRDMLTFINEHDIIFYSDLVDYCKDNNDEWFRCLMGGATFQLEKYIRERRAKLTFNRM